MWPRGNALWENSYIRVVTNRRAILAGLDLAGYGSYLSAPAGKPLNKGFFGGVAQLVRASACHAEGRGFEPRRSRQSLQEDSKDWQETPNFQGKTPCLVERNPLARGFP